MASRTSEYYKKTLKLGVRVLSNRRKYNKEKVKKRVELNRIKTKGTLVMEMDSMNRIVKVEALVQEKVF